MTLSVFFCCCVKQLHTRYHPGVDQYYQTLSFKGTRCKKAGAILVFELLTHNWVTFLVL